MEGAQEQDREAAPIAWLRSRLMRIRPLVELVRRMVMGCGDSPKFKRLVGDVRAGAHESVLDLGCNTASLLEFVQPKRYVGIDERPRSIEFARRRHSRPGWEFVEADFMRRSLEEWRGTDVVVCASLLHHLPDGEVRELIRRVFSEVGAKRVCIAEGTSRGPFQGLLNFLDDGSPNRPKEDLVALVESDYEVEETWQFRTPFRTYDFFGLTVEPRD
jgi:SAM-dependent methyltransferase